MIFFLQLGLTGLMVGGIYALVALGFVMIYKSSRIFNFAQGELVLLGAYLSWAFLQQAGLPLWLSILVSVGIAAGLGFGLERFLLRPMIGQPMLAIIMVTLAIGLFLKGIVTLIWAGERRFFPEFFPLEPYRLGSLMISQQHLWMFIIGMALFVIFVLFFRFTRMGLNMRATAEDHQVSQSMGIRVTSIVGISWAISGIVCLVGGTLLGMINGIDILLSEMGLMAISAALVGGLDSIPGAIVGGLLIGIVESLSGGYVGHGFGMTAVFLVLVLTLIIRPYGILGLKRIERI